MTWNFFAGLIVRGSRPGSDCVVSWRPSLGCVGIVSFRSVLLRQIICAVSVKIKPVKWKRALLVPYTFNAGPDGDASDEVKLQSIGKYQK